MPGIRGFKACARPWDIAKNNDSNPCLIPLKCLYQYDISLSIYSIIYAKYIIEKNLQLYKKSKKVEINFDNVFYLAQYMHNFIISIYNLYKNYW